MATDVGKLNLLLAADASQFIKATNDARASAKKLETDTGGSFSKVGSSAAMMGTAATAALGAMTVAVGAAGAAMGASINAAMGFEKSLSAIKAVSGATGEEMKQISALALQLGKDTSFSASEAAAGIEELIKGGVDIKDVVGGAASAALNLAAAGSVSLADAAEIASNAMSMFNLSGADMTMVADQIAGAANASSLSVTDFKFSLGAVGAVANLAGQSFQDTATAIALMGASGIKGSDAGTSLKTMLMNLIPTTKTQSAAMRELGLLTSDGANKFLDAQGNFRSLKDVAGELNKALEGTSEAFRTQKLEAIFGSDAIRAAAILTKEGAAGFEAMAASMSKVTADQVAKERLNNLSGSLEQLKGSVETAAISFGMHFLPALKGLTDAATKALNDVMPFMDMMGKEMAELPGKLAAAWEGGLPLWKETLQTWGIELVNWVGPQIMPLLNKLQDLREAAFAWVIEQIPGWIETLGRWAVQLVEWVGPMIAPALRELGRFLTRVLDWILEVAPTILQKFIGEWVPAAMGWIAVAAMELGKHLPEILGELARWILVEGVPRVITLFFKLGAALVEGMIQGAASMWGSLFSAIGNQLDSAFDAAKKEIDARSPSRKFMEIGRNISEGIALGIDGGTPRVRQSMADMMQLQRARQIDRVFDAFGFRGRYSGGNTIRAGANELNKLRQLNESRFDQAEGHPMGPLIMRLIELLNGGLTVEMDGTIVGRAVSRGMDQRADLRARMGGAGGLR